MTNIIFNLLRELVLLLLFSKVAFIIKKMTRTEIMDALNTDSGLRLHSFFYCCQTKCPLFSKTKGLGRAADL